MWQLPSGRLLARNPSNVKPNASSSAHFMLRLPKIDLRESSPGPPVLCGSRRVARLVQVAVANLGPLVPLPPHLERSKRQAVTPPSSCSGPSSRLRERHDATSRPQPAPLALHSSQALDDPPLLRYRPMHTPRARLRDNRFKPELGRCKKGLSVRLPIFLVESATNIAGGCDYL
jgi:hypothetical protein